MKEYYIKGCAMGSESREDIKRNIENNGLICDCGEKVYEKGKGAIEDQPNYNKYFDYLECPKCKKLFYL
jgi:uncharacterized protein with PIN domain